MNKEETIYICPACLWEGAEVEWFEGEPLCPECRRVSNPKEQNE